MDVESDVEVTAEAGDAAASPAERRLRKLIERIPGAGSARG